MDLPEAPTFENFISVSYHNYLDENERKNERFAFLKATISV